MLTFATVDLLNFIFRLGVVFAIFGFLWWLIHVGVFLLRGGRSQSVAEAYIIKMVRYFFLVDVTFLFCLDQNDGFIDVQNALFAALILLTFFIGKLQNAQMKSQFFSFKVQGNMQLMNQFKPVFDFKAELIVIFLSLGFFGLFLFYPSFASNPISEWFYESIVDIEDTPVFGFIFKVIGFFFMLSIIMKFVQGFLTLLSGGKLAPPNSNRKDNDKFDDYEEL